jgi:nucleoside phosphorylase
MLRAQHVDVLVVVALQSELAAVREVPGGVTPSWTLHEDADAFPYWIQSFDGAGGGVLRFAVARAPFMAEAASGATAARLVSELRPRCLAMAGVCAGDRGVTELGDVVVAERVYQYQYGKRRGAKLSHDLTTYNLDPRWKIAAEDWPPAWAADLSPGLGRPVSLACQERWARARLLDGTPAPATPPERAIFCPRWDDVVARLRARGEIASRNVALTKRGRLRAERERGRAIEDAPARVHVGVMATGNQVIEVEGIFDGLRRIERNTLAIEMEAFSIGMVAHLQRVEHMLVAKAVVDHADRDKDDAFHAFGCGLSARFVVDFLRRHLKPDDRTRAARPRAAAVTGFIDRYRDREPFGGRSSVLAALRRWLDDPGAPRYALLAAPAGRGKSALLVHWVEELDALATHGEGEMRTVFVPVSILFGLSEERRMFQVLAVELARAHGLPPPTGDVDWRDAARDYLQRPLPECVRILVVIDGLDEANGWQLGPDVLPERPPEGLRVLVSMREGPRSAEAWVDGLGWGDRRVLHVALPPLDEPGIQDVLRRAGPPLDARAGDLPLVRRIARLSDGGDPLLVSLYVKDLRADPRSLDGEEPDQRPSGLDAYFERWWAEQERLWGSRLGSMGASTRLVLDILAMAFAPLVRRELLRLCRTGRADFGGDDLDDALAALTRFVVRRPAESQLSPLDEDAYVLAHPRFRDHRRAKLTRDGDDRRIEEMFVLWGEKTIAAWSARPEPERQDPYIVRYLGAHLDRIGAPVPRFLALVGPAWRSAWHAAGIDHEGYPRDVRLALARAEAANATAIEGLVPFVDEAFRCAFELAEHETLSRRIPGLMLGPLLRYGIWSARLCITYLRQIEADYQRAQGLAAILPHLPPSLLGEAEAILAPLAPSFAETAAPALAAYCERLVSEGDASAASRYARGWRPGVARAISLVRLAGRTTESEERLRLVVEAFGDLGQMDYASLGLLVDEARVALGLDRAEGGAPALLDEATKAHVRDVILDEILGPAPRGDGARLDLRELARDARGQKVKYVLPFLPAAEAGALVAELFVAAREGALAPLADDVLSDLTPHLHPAEIREAIDALRGAAGGARGVQHARALAALTTVLPHEERTGIIPTLLTGLADVGTTSGTVNDWQDLVASLARLGLGAQVLRHLHGDVDEPFTCANLLSAAAPHLSVEDVRRGVEIAGALSEERARERAMGALLARLAAAGGVGCREALALATSGDLHDERCLAGIALRGAAGAPEPPEALRRALLGLKDHAIRVSAIALSGPALGRLHAADLLALVWAGGRTFEQIDLLEALVDGLGLDQMTNERIVDLYKSCRARRIHVRFAARLLALGAKEEAYDFGRRVSAASELGVPVDPGVLAILPDVPATLIEQYRAAAEAADGAPADRGTLLAGLGLLLDDGVWRPVVDAVFAGEWHPDAGDMAACEVDRMLVELPKPLAEQAFADAFAGRFADADGRRRLLSAGVVMELAKYFPASWVTSIEPYEVKVDSSTDRSLAFGALALRMAELDRHADAFAWISRMPYKEHAVGVTALAMRIVPVPALGPWIDCACGVLRDYGTARVWSALATRWSEVGHADALALYTRWLDWAARGRQREVLVELAGFAPLIGRLGGASAAARIEHLVSGERTGG